MKEVRSLNMFANTVEQNTPAFQASVVVLVLKIRMENITVQHCKTDIRSGGEAATSFFN